MITNATNKVVYVSDGVQTEYYFNFVVYDTSHIKVYTRKPNELVSTLLDTSQYSVTLNSDYSGGKIVLNSPLEANTEIAIIREVPITQNMQYIEGDPFPAKSHERALDLLTMICQQLAEKISRALLQDIFDQQEVNITEFLGLLKYFQDNYDDYIKSFNEVYLGAKDTPPTTRNDGTPLQKGDLYFDTTKNGLYTWDGTQWVRISQETLIDGGLLKIWDENSQSFVLSNADKVDSFHASQTPTANTIPVADANGFINDWVNQGAGSGLDADLLKGLSKYLTMDNFMHVQDQKPSGTAGGDSIAGTQIRELNTVLINTISGASLDAVNNQIILPPGTYYIEASAPALGVNRHRIFLYDVTNATTLLIGTSEFTSDSYNGYNRSFIKGLFTISSTTTLEIRHYTHGAVNGGLGVEISDGNVEVYTDVKIWKLN